MRNAPSALVQELGDFRLPGQVLCSLLIIAGHTLVGKERESWLHANLNMFRRTCGNFSRQTVAHRNIVILAAIRKVEIGPFVLTLRRWVFLLAAISDTRQRLALFKACLPWMVGTHVMGRMIAQLVCHTILPEAADDINTDHLNGLFSFLRDNSDMVSNNRRAPENKPPCTVLSFF